MVLKTSGSSRGCPLYWKLSLENVVPPATGSCRKFRPDVWRLVVKVAKQWVVKICRLFQRLIVFQQRTKGQNCKIFTRKSQKRLEQKKNQTNLLFRTFRIATQFKPQAGICSSWRSFFSAFSSWYFSSHKLEYYSTARTGDLLRFSSWYTFRAANWNTTV